MQGDTNTKPNPNETILIPMLHKRVGELTSENILLQAKVQWTEQEKLEMLAEVGAKTQRILDLEHAEASKIESAKASVRAEWEREKSAMVQSLQAEQAKLQQERSALLESVEAEKQKLQQTIEAEKNQWLENEMQSISEAARLRYQSEKLQMISRYEQEKADLQAQVNTLTGTVVSLQAQVNELAAKIPPAAPIVVSAPETAKQPPKPAKKGKKGKKEEPAIMGGGTF